MTDDLTGDLDLLGDWLDAKGYGEEAGLCTRVMDHMHKQDARIAELEALLKPFAQLNANWFGDKMPLQPKSILLEPLPVLYASKYFSEPEK